MKAERFFGFLEKQLAFDKLSSSGTPLDRPYPTAVNHGDECGVVR